VADRSDPRDDLLFFGKRKIRRRYAIVDHAHAMGGRICNLSPSYLDLIADNIRHAVPIHISRDVQQLLVSGRYLRSQHRLLRDVTPERLTEIFKIQNMSSSAARQRRREELAQVHST
jgi:hypothetical protein